jgi:hypothetical protein
MQTRRLHVRHPVVFELLLNTRHREAPKRKITIITSIIITVIATIKYPHLSRQTPVAITIQHSKSSTRILSAHLRALNCSAAVQIIQQIQKLATVNGIRAICVKSEAEKQL